jgi:hypothetical protein
MEDRSGIQSNSRSEYAACRTHKIEGTITYILALRRKTIMSKRILFNSWPFLATSAAVFVLCLLSTFASAQSIPTTLGWYEIPNTRLRSVCPDPSAFPQIQGNEGCSAIVEDWAGGVLDTKRNRLVIWGGGHAGYAGNEVYALDLNSLTMARLNNPTANPSNGCLTNGINASDGTPVARHTYNHLAYLPNQDAMFAFGGSMWQCGSMARDTWLFGLSTLSWTQKSNSNAPRGDFGRSIAYDPNTGLVYARDDFDLYSYNPASDTWVRRSSAPVGTGSYQTGVIDPVRKKYFFYDNGATTLYWYDISSPTGTVPMQSASTSGCSGFIGDYGFGWEYDPVQDKIVGWDGGNTVYLLNPDTLSCTTVSHSGGPAAVANGTFGRFRYSPSLNIFVVCNSVDANCYTLRLTSGSTPPPPSTVPTVTLSANPSAIAAGGASTLTWNSTNATSCTASGGWSGTMPISGSQTTGSLTAITSFTLACTGTGGSASQSATVAVTSSAPPPTPTPSPTPSPAPSTSADADFQARCSAPGVTRCVGFDNTTVDINQSSNLNPGNNGYRGGFDTTVKRSGAGSLRFEQRQGETGQSISGFWAPYPGDALYPAMGAVFGENTTFYVQFAYRISAEVAANMNTWQHSPKIAIFFNYDSCDPVEITTGLGSLLIGGSSYVRPGLAMYADCGGTPFLTGPDLQTWQFSGSLFWQQGAYACQYAVGPRSACWQFPTDKWVTLYYKIHIGNWGQNNSSVEAWYAVDGQPYVKWMNILNNLKLTRSGNKPGFSDIMFTPYMTGNTDITPQTSYIWYDELIVSAQPIAAPGSSSSGSTTTPPAAPSSLVIK